MPAPFFSVIIATLNRADLLPRALESLRIQSFGDWEAVIVDDGSTDDTGLIVREWLADPRFVYWKRPHEGVPRSRNAGLTRARGAWITFLDSDDAYEPNHLESRKRCIDAHPDTRFFHGGFRIEGPPETAFVADARDPSKLIPIADCAVGGTFVVEAGYLKELGGFPDVPYGLDFELMKVAEAKDKVGRCDDPTYIYIREPGVGECEMRRPDAAPET